MLETAYMLFIDYLFGEIDMFWNIKEHKENGEIVIKTFDEIDYPNDHRSKAKSEALSYFEDAKNVAEATYRILASDRSRNNRTEDELKKLYNDAVCRITFSNCLDVLLAEARLKKTDTSGNFKVRLKGIYSYPQ